MQFIKNLDFYNDLVYIDIYSLFKENGFVVKNNNLFKRIDKNYICLKFMSVKLRHRISFMYGFNFPTINSKYFYTGMHAKYPSMKHCFKTYSMHLVHYKMTGIKLLNSPYNINDVSYDSFVNSNKEYLNKHGNINDFGITNVFLEKIKNFNPLNIDKFRNFVMDEFKNIYIPYFNSIFDYNGIIKKMEEDYFNDPFDKVIAGILNYQSGNQDLAIKQFKSIEKEFNIDSDKRFENIYEMNGIVF